MLELNKEYTYTQICNELGWKCTTGKGRKKQLSSIESCYEFYHPINKKTHTEKKSYIFTKKVSETVLEDNRKHNTGGNNSKYYPYIDQLLLLALSSNEGRIIDNKLNIVITYIPILNKGFKIMKYKQEEVIADKLNIPLIEVRKYFDKVYSVVTTMLKSTFVRLEKSGMIQIKCDYKINSTKYGIALASTHNTQSIIDNCIQDFYKEKNIASDKIGSYLYLNYDTFHNEVNKKIKVCTSNDIWNFSNVVDIQLIKPFLESFEKEEANKELTKILVDGVTSFMQERLITSEAIDALNKEVFNYYEGRKDCDKEM